MTIDLILLFVRLVVGGVMIYYGFPKIKDLRANAKDFVGMGFKPGWFWGTIIAFVEFFGGIAILLGYVSLAAAFLSIEMVGGTIWKITKAKKPFPDYSYDLLLLSLALILLAFGGGYYNLGNFLF